MIFKVSMRIWSFHPEYLDAKGLVALWRETLLAQHVLLGKTKGYKNHPQLDRFKEQPDPVTAISAYLQAVAAEANRREYNFDTRKIARKNAEPVPIAVTDGQLAYEWEHLLRKLEVRDPTLLLRWKPLKQPGLHPLFTLVKGPVADWEKV